MARDLWSSLHLSSHFFIVFVTHQVKEVPIYKWPYIQFIDWTNVEVYLI